MYFVILGTLHQLACLVALPFVSCPPHERREAKPSPCYKLSLAPLAWGGATLKRAQLVRQAIRQHVYICHKFINVNIFTLCYSITNKIQDHDHMIKKIKRKKSSKCSVWASQQRFVKSHQSVVFWSCAPTPNKARMGRRLQNMQYRWILPPSLR